MNVWLMWGLLMAVPGCLGLCLGGTKSRLRFAITSIGLFIVGGWLGWFFLPILNLQFEPLYYWMLFGFAIGGLISAVYRDQYGDTGIEQRTLKLVGLCGACALLLFWTVGAAVTWPMFHSGEYRDLLGPQREAQSFSADVAVIDTQRLRSVNQAYATYLADKMLGEQQGLGSRVALGTMSISQLNGCFMANTTASAQPQRLCFEHELVWVAPLAHNGLFKWMSNAAPSHYALVSASDPSRRYIIHTVNGAQVQLRYQQEGAWFGDNLERHITAHYPTTPYTGVTFELDDQGRPWWVAVKYERRIGFSGENPSGVLIIDPASGEIKEYSIEHTPAWVDRIQPEAMVLAQFDWWGEYLNGYWNTWFGRQNIIQTSTDDLHLVEGRDGRTYWYTGVTSTGADQSTSGFVLIDTKTRQVNFYRIPGAIETAAQTSAQMAPGSRERSYTAGEPILYNMGGEPTYFMTLSGDDLVPRMFGFVNVRDPQIVGVADNPAQALQRYEVALRNLGRTSVGQTALPRETIEARVLRAVREGDTLALLLDGQAGAEFFAPTNLSPEVKYTHDGDRVRITFTRSPERLERSVLAFDNLSVDLAR